MEKKKTYEVQVQRVYTKYVYVEAADEDEARDTVEQWACEDDTFFDYDDDDIYWDFEEDWFISEDTALPVRIATEEDEDERVED